MTVRFKPGSTTLKQTLLNGRSPREAPTNLQRATASKPLLTPLDEFGLFYFELMSNMLGNNIGRKIEYQPSCFACVDVNGSKSRAAVTEDAICPHAHALMLVRPEVLRDFQIVIGSALDEMSKIKIAKKIGLLPISKQLLTDAIDDLDCQLFNSKKGTLLNLIEYCDKGVRNTAETDVQMKGQKRFNKRDRDSKLWDLFPRRTF